MGLCRRSEPISHPGASEPIMLQFSLVNIFCIHLAVDDLSLILFNR